MQRRKSSCADSRSRDSAAWRFLEFFTVNIGNAHTRAAHMRAASAFLRWCEGRGILQLQDVKPMHVTGHIEQLQKQRSAPTVKQHLDLKDCKLLSNGEVDLREWVISHLLQENVRFLVIGGWAVTFHCPCRIAKDLDLFVEFSAENWP